MSKFLFLVRSTRFEGYTIYGYADNGNLDFMDFSNAVMSDEVQVHILKYTPLDLDSFKAIQNKSKSITSITEVNKEVQFEDFWHAFKYKVSKRKAEDAWNRLSKDERIFALGAIPKYLTHIKVTGTAQAHATTWLNQKRWEDDYRKK